MPRIVAARRIAPAYTISEIFGTRWQKLLSRARKVIPSLWEPPPPASRLPSSTARMPKAWVRRDRDQTLRSLRPFEAIYLLRARQTNK